MSAPEAKAIGIATGDPLKTTAFDQSANSATSGQPSAQNASDQLPKYEIPSWAGRPPNGCHLDVIKGEQLIQVRSYTGKFYLYLTIVDVLFLHNKSGNTSPPIGIQETRQKWANPHVLPSKIFGFLLPYF